MEETWKDIPGYEGFYQASSIGRIRSLPRICNNGRHINGRLLSLFYDKYGYLKTKLCKNNKPKQYSVHRLVALTFINNPHNYTQINHKDENKKNNNVNNLEWCDCKYNINYGNRTKNAIMNHSGELNEGHKLTNEDVIYIRNHYKFRDKQFNSIALGKKFGIRGSVVRKIVHREIWKHI